MQTQSTLRRPALKATMLATALAGLTLLALPAHAAHGLPAGEVGSPVPSPFPANFSAMTPLASTSSTVTSPGNSFTGTFTSAVYANFASAADAMNTGFTEGMAVLDFVYQFTNAADSATAVGRLSFFDFAPGIDPNQFDVLVWDQAADPDGAGTLFVTGQQEADNAERGAAGKSISLVYGDNAIGNKINPGESSFAILLRVNATNYSSGFFSALNGTPASAPSFAPVAAIPEPETYALLLAGLGAVGFVARRRRSV